MSEYGKPLTLRQFVKSLAADYGKTGIFHIGGRWLVRCADGVLLKDGAPYTRIEDALADLASGGVRRIAIEWDGFSASNRDKAAQ